MNKKGSVVLFVLVIILIIIGLTWLIKVSSRECKYDADCNENSYCGSDFACHEHPVIIREVAKNHLLWPSFFLSIAIVVSVYIISNKKDNKKGKKEEPNPSSYLYQ